MKFSLDKVSEAGEIYLYSRLHTQRKYKEVKDIKADCRKSQSHCRVKQEI